MDFKPLSWSKKSREWNHLPSISTVNRDFEAMASLVALGEVENDNSLNIEATPASSTDGGNDQKNADTADDDSFAIFYTLLDEADKGSKKAVSTLATEGDEEAASTTARGEGDSTARGEGDSTARGEGDSTARREGDSTARREGDSTARGEGDSTARGEGDSTARGEGDSTARGEGDSTAVGRDDQYFRSREATASTTARGEDDFTDDQYFCNSSREAASAARGEDDFTADEEHEHLNSSTIMIEADEADDSFDFSALMMAVDGTDTAEEGNNRSQEVIADSSSANNNSITMEESVVVDDNSEIADISFSVIDTIHSAQIFLHGKELQNKHAIARCRALLMEGMYR